MGRACTRGLPRKHVRPLCFLLPVTSLIRVTIPGDTSGCGAAVDRIGPASRGRSARCQGPIWGAGCMIRFKAGVPRKGRTPTASWVPARTPRRRRPGRLPATRSRQTPRENRLLAVGVPTAWAAAAVAYRLTCPLAHDERLSARLVSSAVLCAIGTGIVLHVRHTLLRELRRARWAAEAAHGVLLR